MTATPESPWTPAMVTALFGGIAILIAALGTMIAQIIGARRAIVASEHATTQALGGIEKSVNGGMSAALARLAVVEQLLADETGRKADRVRAESSQAIADDHKAVAADIRSATPNPKK